MLKLAFRNIFRNRLRTSLTLAAIITGVIAIIISGGFVEDVFVQLRESTIHSRIGHIQIFRNGFADSAQGDPLKHVITQPKIVQDAVQSIPHVKAVMSRVSFSGLANNGRADLPIIGEGVEPGKEARLGTSTTIVAGRSLQEKDTFGMVIGEGVAAALKLKPGSFVTLMVNTREGALNTLEYEVVGVFRTFSKDYDDRAVRISLPAAQELLFTQSIHSVVVLLDDTSKTDLVAAAVRAKLAPLGYTVKPWYELADFYQKTEALYRRQFGALQSIILVMLVLSVASTINMVVYERTGEFGTLLAVGLRRSQLFKLVLLENALLGLIGSFLGVVIGIGLAVTISGFGLPMPPPPGSNIGYIATIRLVPWVVATAMLIGALAAIVAAVLPARRASRLLVVDALRHNI
ncbi:ABC transporter permease [Sulfurirhabdus autotrophica]|uniref:Putative ABC transport system permease protein n=1 Tax=Sulfurirhabdus autotrophica TaxID=1706046 RepID=A0A4R3XUI6_9PROT|nr:ABC transporter permease [Sulfurirhabdus autotrophica]TCV82391.1 putative ABC transport system permease protein [Sulfurirhabdus autotrophica]